ncbi:Nuclear pore complex subunit, partial [Spiromyces aspiralis]
VPSGKAASVAATAASGSPARPQRSLEEVVLASLRDALLQSSLGKRILSQLSQGHTFNAFSNFEVQVWALRSLAMFVHHSLDEDDFGVVQKDIPAIMTSLLAYLAQLELFIMDAKGAGYSSSWANSGARMPAAVAHNRQLAFNSQLAHPQAHALIQVVRNCLYIFTVTFFDHLDEFKFPTHVRQHLELFKTFQA